MPVPERPERERRLGMEREAKGRWFSGGKIFVRGGKGK